MLIDLYVREQRWNSTPGLDEMVSPDPFRIPSVTSIEPWSSLADLGQNDSSWIPFLKVTKFLNPGFMLR